MGVLSVYSILVITGLVRPRRDGVDIVLEFLKKENAELNTKIERLEHVINSQSLEIKRLIEQHNAEMKVIVEQHNVLRMQIILLEASRYDLPYPQWMFDFRGNLVSGNKAFEDTFLTIIGKNLINTIGESVADVLDKEAAIVYMENHRWVLSEKHPWEGALTVIRNGKQQWLDMVLYPAYSGKLLIGVSGMVIPARRVENF